MRFYKKVMHSGNSMIIRIPKEVLDWYELESGDMVSVEISKP